MKLWLAQFACQFADRMFVYILIFSIYELVQKSNLGTSLSTVSFGIPAILFSLLFGVLVDRYKKKHILFASNIIRALLIILIMSISFLEHSLWGVFGISLIVFTVSQIFIPAELAAITHVVSQRELILANSLFTGTWMLASVASFGIAVPITYYYGINGTYSVIVGLYLLAALLIAFIHDPEKITKKRIQLQSLYRELRLGVRFVLKHRIMFFAMLQMGFGLSILAVLSVLSIGFTNQVLHMPQSDYGYFVALAGIGMGVGIALISRMIKHFNKLTIVFIGFNLVGLMLFCFGFVTSIPWAFSIVFVLGMGNAFINAPVQTIIQERTPKQIRGKVFSVQNLVGSIAFTFPPVIAGLIADLYGYRAIMVTLGLTSLLLNFTIKKLKK